MVNGIIDIGVFDILDEIARNNKISAGSWAKESGLKHRPRISELRKMAQLAREGKNPSKVGRAFTISKCLMTLNGLKTLIGEDIVTKPLLNLLKKTKNRKERILLMVLGLSTEQEVNTEMYLETLLKASIKK